MSGVRRDQLKPADHIYTSCGLYYHHGIHVGKATVTNPNSRGEERKINDAVIHFLGIDKKSGPRRPCKTCFHLPQTVGVVITCLDCFTEGGSIYVYEYNASHLSYYYIRSSGSCSTSASRPPDVVIQTAYALLEKKIDFGEYSLLFNNCEDFATYCKTGKAISNQAAGMFYGFGFVYNVIKDTFYSRD
ncbi:hypothetical protein PTKIN_Ptkin06aG0186200 [Pterospermum kingtungense]